MDRLLIKQDINFLEYPLWFQDNQMAEKAEHGFVWEDLEGFVYRAGYKPPVKIDLIFLLYFLLRSQEQEWEEELELTRYEILKACEVGISTYWYGRLEESLKRWKMTGIEYKGSFYDGKEYQIMNFGVIDDWEIEKNSKKLRIRFSPRWLERIQHSHYFKMLDFKQIKSIQSPLASRLFELLVKTFEGRNTWSIGAKKLAAKIPMNEKYPAHIIPKIETAVRRINEKTELQIELEVRRPKRGVAIFDFRKLQTEDSQEAKTEKAEVRQEESKEESEEEQWSLEQLLELIPPKERDKKTLLEQVQRNLSKNGTRYVRGNILYANEHAKTNYRTYLIRALKEDWGAGYLEELEQREQQKRAKEAQAKRARELEQEQEQIQREAHELLLSMSEQQQQELEQQARASLSPELLCSPLASSLLKMQMRAFLAKRIADESP